MSKLDILSQNNTAISNNNLTIAENIEKVYNSGYKKAIDTAETQILKNKAMATKLLSLNDVSPIEHIMKVKVSSTNILPPLNTKHSLAVFTFDGSAGDGSIVINGIGDNKTYDGLTLVGNADDMLVDGATYTMSMDISSIKSKLNLIIHAKNLSNNSNVFYQAMASNGYIVKFTVDKSKYKYQRLFIQINPTTETYENVVIKPILALGDYTSLPFIPYVPDVSATKLIKQGKNLFNNDTNLLKEVTYTNRSEAKVTRIGYELKLPAGTYTLTTNRHTYDANDYLFTTMNNKNGESIASQIKDKNGASFPSGYIVSGNALFSPIYYEVNEGDIVYIYNAGATLNVSTAQALFSRVDFQLEMGDDATDYEPYIEPIEYPISADGTVEGITSLYPTTTLCSDTEGVLIEAEYNMDVRTAYEKGLLSHTEQHMRNCDQQGGYALAFAGYGWRDNTYNPIRPIRSGGTYNQMFQYSNITDTKVDIDVSLSATNRINLFAYATKLKTIRKIITAKNIGYASWFESCKALENITFEGEIGRSINFSYSPLSVESMKNVIGHLVNYAGTENELSYTVTFTEACWTKLEADSTAPNGGTWKEYVASLGWNI